MVRVQCGDSMVHDAGDQHDQGFHSSCHVIGPVAAIRVQYGQSVVRMMMVILREGSK